MDDNNIKILRYDDKYLSEFIEFIRQVWVKDISKEKLLQRREDDLKRNPYGRECGFPIVIAMHNNRMVGHIALKPCGFLLDGKEISGYWQAGIHVFPEVRSQGVATSMSKLLIENKPIVTGFFVVEQTLKLKKKLGWDLPGKIPEYIKFLRPKDFIIKINLNNINIIPDQLKKLFEILHNIAKKPTAYVFLLVINVINKIKIVLHQTPDTSNIQIVDKFDTKVDELWELNKKFLINAQVRKSQYLNWAFDDEKGWIKAVYKKEDEVQGYVILSLKHFEPGTRLSNIVSVSIIDIFWDFSQIDIFRALIAFSEKFAFENGADILFCTINNRNIKKYLKRHAFFEIPRSVYFSIYSANKQTEYSTNLSDWFITRGDADAAGALGMEIKG